MNYQTKKHFLKTLKLLSIVAFITVTLALFGCGGGGGSSGGGGAANTAPTASDGTLTTDENVVATGDLIADDADGDALTYSIVTNGGIGTATITNADTGSYTYTPNPNVNGIDTFTFKVNDGTEDSNTATVTVTINPVNNPPTANAGPDQPLVNEQTPVALDGSGSDDGDGGVALSYAWTQTGGLPVVQLIDADTATPSFTAPAVSVSTPLTFELEVTDSGLLTDTDQVVVTVNNAGNLTGYVNDEQPDTVNLETEGTLDWKHWGLVDKDSVNQKAGVTEQISDWDFIGGLFYDANSGSSTAYSWSNGAPTADEPGTFRSVFFPTPNLEIGEGYTFTVSADASEKTLRVYLGVFGARAKFRAFLSDGSAPELVEFFENPNPLEKFQMVTVNFGAASDGQTLTIEVTYEADLGGDGSANVSIQAATLAPGTVATPTIDPPNGTFTDSVNVTLATATPNATIRYTTDGSDPTSNSTLYTGPFNLTASANVRAKAFLAGFADSSIASAQFTVNANAGGSLSAFINASQPDTVNLETEGTLDWKHWGLVDKDSVNQKAGVTEQISDWDFIGGLFYDANSGSTTAYSWSNGAPTADEPGTFRSVFFPTPNLEIGEGYTFTVSADASEKTLRVYLGVFGARAKFRAFLSDASAPELVEFFENPNPLEKFQMVTVNFGAASDGQTLTIEVTYEADLGGDGSANVSIQAATLAPTN